MTFTKRHYMPNRGLAWLHNSRCFCRLCVNGQICSRMKKQKHFHLKWCVKLIQALVVFPYLNTLIIMGPQKKFLKKKHFWQFMQFFKYFHIVPTMSPHRKSWTAVIYNIHISSWERFGLILDQSCHSGSCGLHVWCATSFHLDNLCDLIPWDSNQVW